MPDNKPFAAPDELAPYVDQVLSFLQTNPGKTSREVRQALSLGENVARASLDRLASKNLVHCTLRRVEKKRGAPPREYHPGPCPILVN